MSYNILRNIKIDEKRNSITVTVASNNLIPHSFYTTEYGAGKSFKDKIICLLEDIDGGEIAPNTSLYKLNYAFQRAKHELGIESFWSLRNPKKIFYYAANGGTPYFAYTTEEYAITDEQIASGEYVVVDESRKRYRKLSEIEEQEAEITSISEKFYALFMQYYREKAIKGLFAVRIKTDEYERYIKPRANCNGYYYGYRLDQIKNYPSVQKKWAFPFERAYLYSLVYNAQIIPIA